MTCKIFGCHVLDIPQERTKEKLRFGAYMYSFHLFFSSDSVGFLDQALYYQVSDSFLHSQDISETNRSWDIHIEASYDQKSLVKIKKFSDDASQLFPFFPIKDTPDLRRRTEQLLESLLSISGSIPDSLGKFSFAFQQLTEDISGGQTYNIIPSQIRLAEDSARPPGIASDGSGVAATLYAIVRANKTNQLIGPTMFSRPPITTLTLPEFGRLKEYFRLANETIRNIRVTNDPFDNQLRVQFEIESGTYLATVPLSLMSDGTLKWITLLTAAVTVSSIFSIEEPENYLHPNMQAEFIKLMREILFSEKPYAATIMTTHSETVLNNCKPNEIVLITLINGQTVARRYRDEEQLSREIERTGFGLGYYYVSGGLSE